VISLVGGYVRFKESSQMWFWVGNQRHFDFVVVGSGSRSHCLIARRATLCQYTKSICHCNTALEKTDRIPDTDKGCPWSDAIPVSPQLLAMPSVPPNIRLHVIMVDTHDEAKNTLSAAVKEWVRRKAKERLIIFCLSILMCHDLMDHLNNQALGTDICLFHSGVSKEECKQNLTQWSDAHANVVRIMIATSGF
jgi:superfamily II DNA helicase RecQ